MASSSLCLAIVIAPCILLVLLLFKYIYVQRRRNYRRSQDTDLESMPHFVNFDHASPCSGHLSQGKMSGLLVGLLGSPFLETRRSPIRENSIVQCDNEPRCLHQLPALQIPLQPQFTPRTTGSRPPGSFSVPNTEISSTNLINRNKSEELCSGEPVALINWQMYLPRPLLVVTPLQGNPRHVISVGVRGFSWATADVLSTNGADPRTNVATEHITGSIQVPGAAALLIPTAMDDDLAKEWVSHENLTPIPWSIAPSSSQIARPSGVNQYQLPDLPDTLRFPVVTLSQTLPLSSDPAFVTNDPGLHDTTSPLASTKSAVNAAPKLQSLLTRNHSPRYLSVSGSDPRVQSSPSTADRSASSPDAVMRSPSRSYKGRNSASRPSPLRTMVLPPEDSSVDCASTDIQGHAFVVIENSDNLLEFISELVNETNAWDPDLFVDRNFKAMIDRCRPFSPQDWKIENLAFPPPARSRPTRSSRHGTPTTLEAIPENGVMGL